MRVLYLNPFNAAPAPAGWTYSTPVMVSNGSGNPTQNIDVPPGTDAILFFVLCETGGASRLTSAISDGVQSAMEITGASQVSGPGPTISGQIWMMMNPTVGSSTWTWSQSGNNVAGRIYGYSFVTGLDTGSPSAGTTQTSALGTNTSVDTTFTTTVAGALIVSIVGGRDPGDTWSWTDPAGVDDAYNTNGSGFTSFEGSIAFAEVTTATAYTVGGDFVANPTRSVMVTVGLAPG